MKFSTQKNKISCKKYFKNQNFVIPTKNPKPKTKILSQKPNFDSKNKNFVPKIQNSVQKIPKTKNSSQKNYVDNIKPMTQIT